MGYQVQRCGVNKNSADGRIHRNTCNMLNFSTPRIIASSDNPFYEYYHHHNQGPVVHKWSQYFDIYHRYFQKFRNQEIHFLEIGVQSGGTIGMWKSYFGNQLFYYGVDINPYTKPLFDNGENVKIYVGSQSNRTFWQQVLGQVPKLDIVLDDGGHTMEQQTTTFEEVYKHVKPNGIYMVEDTATSYQKDFGGGLHKNGTWMERAKHLVDEIHGWYHTPSEFTHTTVGLAVYDQMVVFEKGPHQKPVFPQPVGSMRMDYMPPTLNGDIDPAVLAKLQRMYGQHKL